MQSPMSSGDPVQLLKENSSKLVKCLMFDINKLAREMNCEGLLSEHDYDRITGTTLNEGSKAEILMKSLTIKVELSMKHLVTMKKVLEKDKKLYSDAIEILEGIDRV